MIGTRSSPAASSALRIPATRPSIMSLGATMSTPARACDTATLPSRYTEASFSISPSCTTPQCPWSVYSHRHTSPTTSSWGTARLSARAPRGAGGRAPAGAARAVGEVGQRGGHPGPPRAPEQAGAAPAGGGGRGGSGAPRGGDLAAPAAGSAAAVQPVLPPPPPAVPR